MTPSVKHIAHLFLVAGVSGAGRSSALALLHDLGFYTLENLPAALFPQFLEQSSLEPERFRNTCIHLEFGPTDTIDEFLKSFAGPHGELPPNVTLIFVDAGDSAILKRYSETRRPHRGFDPKLDSTILDAISRERRKLIRLKEVANVVIDTTELTIHQFRRRLKKVVDELNEAGQSTVRVHLVSFGFKYGLPLECDLVIDVRFLPNPHFVSGLREKSGSDREVIEFVLSQPDTAEFLERYTALLNFLIPRYVGEGKSYVTIGIGCTGGRHRSPVLADAIRERLKLEGCFFSTHHRDIDRP